MLGGGAAQRSRCRSGRDPITSTSGVEFGCVKTVFVRFEGARAAVPSIKYDGAFNQSRRECPLAYCISDDCGTPGLGAIRCEPA
jgi:hypothetical protein